MAQPTGLFASYDAVGNREDLTDMIWDISPTETPVVTAIGKGKATAVKHEWQTDALAAAAANAHIEGEDASPASASATSRLDNATQILKKHVVVSGTQEAVDKAGRNSEIAYQRTKRMSEIKRDLEYAIVGLNNAKVATGGDSTAREMGSLSAYLKTNTDFDSSSGGDPTGNGVDGRTDGTQRAFLESQLQTVLQSCFDNGGNPSLMITGSYNKRVASGFDGGQTAFQDKSDKKLVNAVDVYVGDFHELNIVADRFSRSRDVYLIDPEYLKIAELRPIQTKELAVTGDAYREEILMEVTLEVCNEAAHGGVFDLTTS